MLALITGGYGFVGRHLAHHLVSCGDDVVLTYTEDKKEDVLSGKLSTELGETPAPRTVQNIALDVTNKDLVNQVISLIKPDVIYHLAAISFVPDAEKDPNLTYKVNTLGALNILEAVKEYIPDTRVLFVGSSQSYGAPRPGALPITELSELRPSNMYALTKTYADLACYTASSRDSLNVVRARPFQHTGPGQNPMFALSSFSKQVAEIKLGKKEPIVRVGNLDVKRDYTDVSDIVRGYREAALNGKVGEAYNFCFGQSVSMEEMLNLLIKRSGVEIEVIVDPSRVRPVEVPDVYGSFDKAQKDLGWKPRVTHEGMLDSLLTHWMEVLS